MRGNRLRLAGSLALAALLLSCGPAPKYVRPTDDAGRAERVDPGRVHAVLINGGANRGINYQSHVIHLREVLRLLESAGVPPDQIAVFASDGEAPGKDLATRELRPEGDDGWLLDGTNLERAVGRPMEYVSTQIDGVELRPATQASLADWFAKEGDALGPGDVVFFYVTDHGTQGSEDAGPRGNAISLWGKGEHLTVDELASLVDGLPRGVQVVTLMSQCFSGGFAQLVYGDGDDLPNGRLCGYFSTTADREAYGCYAENRGDDNVGHSIRFLEGLAGGGRMESAHLFTVVNDHTPDVPLRTSDEYVREILEYAAWESGQGAVEYADALVAEALRNPARYEDQIRLLDRIGQSFGFASPRSLAEVDARLDQLPKVGEPLAKHSEAWSAALRDLSRENVRRFFVRRPEWVERLKADKLPTLEPEEARALGGELVAELGPATRKKRRTYSRLTDLRSRADTASSLSYRMEVREAALLRMQSVLIDIAGQVYLETRASDAERDAYSALRSCEDLALPLDEVQAPRDREAFPAYSEDLELAKTVLPAWMGIQFKQAPKPLREKHGLEDGAVTVQRVYPGSPAEAAGIEIGDVILGPPGGHFREARQIREWTMRSRVGVSRKIDVLRGEGEVVLTLVPGAHPGSFPELPAPPGPGDKAPSLKLSSYRGDLPVELRGDSNLLFFWATWCVPCKHAVPEVLAYAKATGTPVIAITDESADQLDPFFEAWDKDFPKTVGMDRNRATFLSYGVSGTPTFVLVGADGIVASASTGYSREKSLGIDGWTWEE